MLNFDDSEPNSYNYSPIHIKYFNACGLTRNKFYETEAMCDDNSIICLTETHMNSNSIDEIDNYFNEHGWRGKDSKQGGGTLIMTRKDAPFAITRYAVENEDILAVKVVSTYNSFVLVVTYWDVKDIAHNEKIAAEIEALYTRFSTLPFVIVGDFNARLKYFNKTSNKNAHIFQDLIDNCNLNVGNGQPFCIGEYTWSRGNQRSVIDYVLFNDLASKRVKEIYISDKPAVEVPLSRIKEKT